MKDEIFKDEVSLYEAFGELKTQDEIRWFMADLCILGKIRAFTERWAIARLLYTGNLGYREVASEIKADTTIVARVPRFLKQLNYQGYRIILDRLKTK